MLDVSFLMSCSICIDYFFSGHMGIPVIIALEFSRKGKSKLAYLFHFLNVGQAIIMCILQIHYTVDIVAGVLSAIVCYHYSAGLEDSVNRFLYGSGVFVKGLFGIKSKRID